MSKKVAVIGGGISGLSAAYRLMKDGVDVVLFEKNERAGGAIRTGKEGGYLFEYGPNSTMNSNDEIDSLCKELGLEDERIFGSEYSKKRYVGRGGRLVALPIGPIDFLRTGLWSIWGKLRLFKEPFVGLNKGGNESVADFVSRRIGREMLDYALDPFVSGVYAGDPSRLELKSTFPKMADLEREHGSLIIGALKKAFSKKNKSDRKKGIFSFKGGMSALSEAIATSLGDRFKGGSDVKKISKEGEGYLIELAGSDTVDVDEVIITSPSYVIADMIRDLSSSASELLAAIEYAPIAIVYLGFKREDVSHPLDGFGCLIAGKEKKKLLGSLWSSSLFPGRAPEGMVSLTCFTGGARNRDMMDRSDDEILADVVNDLNGYVGIKGKPSFVRLFRHNMAIPQYNMGHGKRLEKLEAALEEFKGLHLLGNYLKGVSVADCVKNGAELASKISKNI
ncbi:MAG: protoporphyrinogen oxidase [bacterium]|nr:protoporphyrinogen oxidase [bacterium]